jgi:uncharacterized Zn finger protein
MGYWGSYYPAYVSVAERRAKAEKAAAKAKKAGASYTPIDAYRGAVAKTFWGKAWCNNLEAYSDYANRLPRGRTYVRNGSVIDLQIKANTVQALVMGSSLYSVDVHITQVPNAQWQAICTDCASSIDTLVDLLQGKLAKPVMERICKPLTGLFPSPKEIRFTCNCPDSAGMCKHIAAVLYGVGARLDQQPDLLFTLRQVQAKDLVAQAGSGLPAQGKQPTSRKVLDDAALADVFGLEMDEPVSASTTKVKPVKERAKTATLASKKLSASDLPNKAKTIETAASTTPAEKRKSTRTGAKAGTKVASKVASKAATQAAAKIATKPATKLASTVAKKTRAKMASAPTKAPITKPARKKPTDS